MSLQFSHCPPINAGVPLPPLSLSFVLGRDGKFGNRMLRGRRKIEWIRVFLCARVESTSGALSSNRKC